MNRSFKLFSLLAVSGVALAACQTAPNSTAFQPQCDFRAYQEALQNTSGFTLVPMVVGSSATIPLDSVLVNSPELGKKVVPIATGGERLPNRTLNVFARIQNCTDEPVNLQARASFYDAMNADAEAPTAWTTIFIPPNSRGMYETSSLSADAASYLIELIALPGSSTQTETQ